MKIEEAKKDMYHSVWIKPAGDLSWSHSMDHTDRDEAKKDSTALKAKGHKVKIIRTSKNSQDWNTPEHKASVRKQLGESTYDLVDAIISGDSVKFEDTFESIMRDKIADSLDSFRSEISQNMFGESVEEETIEEDFEISDEQILEDIMALELVTEETVRKYFDKAAFDYVRGTTQSTRKPLNKKSLGQRILSAIKGSKKLTKEEVEIFESVLSEETIDETIKVGDHVHVGHMVKGGAGVSGKVTKIDGEEVHIEEIGSKSKFGPKSWKGLVKNTSKK